jgi:hypothetical protein
MGQSPGNPFFLNTLNNLKALTGEPARIRIGGNSEDRTNFNPSVQVCSVPHLGSEQYSLIIYLALRQPISRHLIDGAVSRGHRKRCRGQFLCTRVIASVWCVLSTDRNSRSLSFSGSSVVWGVNFGQNNLTAAFLEATAIANAFASSSFQNSKITLEAIEIGNEADLYTNNGLRDSSFNVQKYVTQYVCAHRMFQ